MPSKLQPVIIVGTVVCSLAMTSCASSFEESTSSVSAPQAAGEADVVAEQNVLSEKALSTDGSDQAPEKRSLPQLIKKAQMELRVDEVETAVKSISKIVKAQQGDVFGLQDHGPPDQATRRIASMELRVPQSKLDTTLDQLAELGTVQSRSLSAEDVSNQLVDFQARLRNLRKSEQVVLKIMERSGSIADVLKVSQELSNIRASIEQIDAQLKRLQTQVAFSTITLRLEQAIASTPPQASLGDRLQESWSQSTHAVGELTVGLMALGVWLLAFSPYLLGLGLLGFAGKRLMSRRQPHEAIATSLDSPLPPTEG